jgi:hypothetical protein
MDGDNRKAGMVVGWAIYGCILIGMLSVLGALLGGLAGNWELFTGSLLSGAVVFGLLANAALRQ